MSAQFWVFLALDSWWLNFMTDFFFLRYCYSDLSEIHVHPFDDKSFVKFIIHIDSFPIQSSIQLMFINLIMLCKKVSDIWQYITVRTAAGSMGARAVQFFFWTSFFCPNCPSKTKFSFPQLLNDKNSTK